eukprot:549128-Pyramimonas_sp.AAC.1
MPTRNERHEGLMSPLFSYDAAREDYCVGKIKPLLSRAPAACPPRPALPWLVPPARRCGPGPAGRAPHGH